MSRPQPLGLSRWLSTAPPRDGRRAVGWWLASLAALVLAMVLLGGATRLTGSGLSIVEWRPVTGILPPLSAGDWQAAFADYQATPEYARINRGMTLEGFKRIFWLEYFHRLLGRLIGLAFLLPFAWFLWLGWLTGRLAWPLAGIFLLGGLQGAVGWWMVASGLVEQPAVSHYRLSAHLALAIAIFAMLLRLSLGLLDRRTAGRAAVRRAAAGIILLLFVQMLSGALVAGLDAGLGYNSFPDMGGWFLPPEAHELSPAWRNHLDNPAMVQFQHRLVAYLAAVAVLTLWWRGRARDEVLHWPLNLLVMLTLLQFGLGVWVVLAGVPVWLGVAHQGGAMALLAAALWTWHRAGPLPPAEGAT